jgi:acetyl-CoA carboxylase biotin carboxylase subunit
MFRKVLIANRGEIAIRVMRTLRELGIGSVAVYSEADRDAMHVQYADEAYCVGPAASRESYLRMDKILEVARATGAEAIHPGYGFLSENADFARACAAAGIVFIGPPADAIDAMGEKTRARRKMIAAQVPVVPGTEAAIEDSADALEFAKQAGFPVLVKAAAGGGGKGMRRVDREEDFIAAFEGARREAQAAFGNGDCYIEKWILQPKHVEIQVLADQHGNVVHLFERDCSVQRRHQKVVEESPCPILRQDVRDAMGRVAVLAAKAVDYVGAGTIEFLIDAEQNFYFLEMNTRLQVEHPVTEMVTGIDLVEQQLRVAAGQPLPFRQEDLRQTGHAIEVRIYAEDPANNFLPSPGPITKMVIPEGHGVRNDAGYTTGTEVSLHYDPMIAKFIVHGADREQARARMLRCLGEYVVQGIETNTAFLSECLRFDEFIDGHYDTGMIGRMKEGAAAEVDEEDEIEAIAVAALVEHLRREAARGAQPAATAQETPSRWALHGRLQATGRM